MSKRDNIKTTIVQIAEYWSKIQPVSELDLMFDWNVDYCKVHCWNCGNRRSKPQKAHIIPDALGGEDVPSNYILLCGKCHPIAPDVDNSEAMWDWIKGNKKPLGLADTYFTQEALINFKSKNNISFFTIFDTIAKKSSVEGCIEYLKSVKYEIKKIGNSWNVVYPDVPEEFNTITRKLDDSEVITAAMSRITQDIVNVEFLNIGFHGGMMATSSIEFMFNKIFKEYHIGISDIAKKLKSEQKKINKRQAKVKERHDRILSERSKKEIDAEEKDKLKADLKANLLKKEQNEKEALKQKKKDEIEKLKQEKRQEKIKIAKQKEIEKEKLKRKKIKDFKARLNNVDSTYIPRYASDVVNTGEWSKLDEDFLITYYPTNGRKFCAELLCRDDKSVAKKINYFKLRKN